MKKIQLPDERFLNLVKKKFHKDDYESHVIELLAPFLRRNPKHAFGWYMYGESLRTIGRSAEAIDSFKKVLKFSKSKTARQMAMFRIGTTFKENGSPLSAELWFKKSNNVKKFDKEWEWLIRGANLTHLERFDDALRCYRKAEKMQAVNRDEVYLNMGLVYRAKRQYSKAVYCLKKSLSIDPRRKATREALQDLKGIEDTIRTAKNFLKG